MTDETSATNLLELAAELTVAWLSNPNTKVPAEAVPDVIQRIHGALSGLGGSRGEDAPARQEYPPAVSARRSLASKEHIVSMIDGKPYKMLKRHLATHGLTPDQYRERYGLRADYPMVAEKYAETRRNLAKKSGLGRKRDGAPAGKPARGKEAPAG